MADVTPIVIWGSIDDIVSYIGTATFTMHYFGIEIDPVMRRGERRKITRE